MFSFCRRLREHPSPAASFVLRPVGSKFFAALRAPVVTLFLIFVLFHLDGYRAHVSTLVRLLELPLDLFDL